MDFRHFALLPGRFAADAVYRRHVHPALRFFHADDILHAYRIAGVAVAVGEQQERRIKATCMRLFIQADGGMSLLGQRKLDQDDLSESLSRMFEKNPDTRIMLLTADGVTMQQLVNIMDRDLHGRGPGVCS